MTHSTAGEDNTGDPWMMPSARLRCEPFGPIRPIEARPAAGQLQSLDPVIEGLLFHSLPSCFALLDSGQIAGLTQWIEDSDSEACCLFDGAAAQDFAEASPWLVRLNPSDRLTKRLFTRGDADWHLWGRNSGCFVLSDLPLTDLRAHFRKYTRIRATHDGKWRYFRFWESHAITAIANYLARIGRDDLGLFDPAGGQIKFVTLPDGRTPECWSLTERQPSHRAARTKLDAGLEAALARGFQLRRYAQIAMLLEQERIGRYDDWPALCDQVRLLCDRLVSDYGLLRVKSLTALSICLIGYDLDPRDFDTDLRADLSEEEKVRRVISAIRQQR